ncbi:MAG: hypothetical protein EOP33_09225 [Rickettsiaceae bacterium]|nr:MAG: hypothetical protein EOP33_09225 [Rickettsiaceae bacterium]
MFVCHSYLRSRLEKAKKTRNFCFINPSLSSYIQNDDEEAYLSKRVKDVGNVVRHCKFGELVLMPYNKGAHWMLVVLDLWRNSAMFFDPLRNKIPTDLNRLIKR